jgi:hypothetical protein
MDGLALGGEFLLIPISSERVPLDSDAKTISKLFSLGHSLLQTSSIFHTLHSTFAGK